MKVHLYSKKHPGKNPHAFFFFFLINGINIRRTDRIWFTNDVVLEQAMVE